MKNITLIPGSDLHSKFKRLARHKQWRKEINIVVALWGAVGVMAIITLCQ